MLGSPAQRLCGGVGQLGRLWQNTKERSQVAKRLSRIPWQSSMKSGKLEQR